MKLARLSTLSAAILIASTAYGNAFVDDSTLNLHLRNYYKHDSIKNHNIDNDSTTKSYAQWAQAIRLDFSSGFYNNFFGIDIGMHHALKARGDKDSQNGLLYTGSDGNVDGYGKVSFAIKANLMDHGIVKYGRLFINTPLLNDSDSRSLPSLTEGLYAEGQFHQLHMYGIIALQENAKNKSGFTHYGYIDENGEKKDSVVHIVGLDYDIGHGLSASAAYGQQEHVANRFFADLDYATSMDDIDLTFGLQYGNNARRGSSKVSGEDNSQSIWGAKAQAQIDNASIGISYTTVDKTDVGDYQFAWGMNQNDSAGEPMGDSTGFFGYNAVQISDFNKSGQDTWGLNASYNFDNALSGLNVHGAYVQGKVSPINSERWTETEYNLGVSYDLPKVEGLSAHVLYAQNTEKDRGLNESDEQTDAVKKDTRVIVKYDIAIF